ncbi:Protein CBG04680 [Caenorhabditis briggsae]|uniref:Protein CBG04680 n=1 Tax=Caenorhabditis briggsae TaxID=6238 RepID=A8WY79_CAEBR|nr:Protein CBG04680 [Caenorhabditis briggsae]CAP25337.1 Protein CBG04680 [Caenorhabditis briggsae]
MASLWNCFSTVTAKVEPVAIAMNVIPEPVEQEKREEEPEIDKFLLLSLPKEIVIFILGFCSPFDLLAFSLISKRTRKLAIKARKQPDVQKKCKVFKMCLGVSYQKIIMEFDEQPKKHWQLMRHRDLSFKPHIGEVVLKEVDINGWSAKEYVKLLFADPEAYYEGFGATFSTVYINSDYSIQELNMFYDSLCELFNPVRHITSIHLDCPYIEHILWHYNTKESFQYLVIETSDQTSETYIRSVFDRVRISNGVFLRCKTEPSFYYDLSRFEVKEIIEVHWSYWVKLDQVFNIKSHTIALFVSSWFCKDLKVLIQKWRDGWTPEWNQLTVELKSMNKELEDCVEGESVEIGNAKDKSLVYKNSSIQLYKFNEKYRIEDVSFYIDGYHIVREDGAIATVLITKGNVAIMTIQSERTKEFKFDFNRRLFLPRKAWSSLEKRH